MNAFQSSLSNEFNTLAVHDFIIPELGYRRLEVKLISGAKEREDVSRATGRKGKDPSTYSMHNNESNLFLFHFKSVRFTSHRNRVLFGLCDQKRVPAGLLWADAHMITQSTSHMITKKIQLLIVHPPISRPWKQARQQQKITEKDGIRKITKHTHAKHKVLDNYLEVWWN